MKNPEFKAKKLGNDTVYTLTEMTAGAIGSSSITSVAKDVGGVQQRRPKDSIIVQGQHNKETTIPASTPRNPFGKTRTDVNQKPTGSGQHRNKKKEQRLGVVKHKKPFDMGEDHSTASGGWGQESYVTAGRDSSKWTGAGHNNEMTREDSMSGADIPDNELDQVHPSDTGTDDEYGMEGEYVKNQLHTIIRAATHLGHALDDQENLPTWVIDKISQSKGMLVAVFDYMISEKELGMGQDTTADEHPAISEDDQYISELYSKLSEKIAKNAPVDAWVQDFQKANPEKYHQFRQNNRPGTHKPPEKIAQMAIAASYGAKNPSKNKK